MSNENDRRGDATPLANTTCPLARRERLTIRELPDETLIYDLDRHRMHCLNRTSALVWRHCDGQRDLPALIAVVAHTLRLPEMEASATTRLALEQLNRRELLIHGAIVPLLEEQRTTRRDALRRLVNLTAGALPLVMTLRSPAVAWAAGNPCWSNSQCAEGELCGPAFGPNFSEPGRCYVADNSRGSRRNGSSPPTPTNNSCVRTCVYDQNGALLRTSDSGCVPCNAGACPPNGPANGVTGINGTC